MREGRDWYRVLQIVPEAEPEVVEAAYRRLAKKYHPDVSGSPDAERRMRELNAAYEVLRDPVRRAAYDREHLTATDAGPEEPPFAAPPPEPTPRPGAEGRLLACRQHQAMAAVGLCGDCGAGLCPWCFDRFQPATCATCLLAWASRRRAELLLPAVRFFGVLLVLGGLVMAAANHPAPGYPPPTVFGWALMATYVLASLPSGWRALGLSAGAGPGAIVLWAAVLGPIVAPFRMGKVVLDLHKVGRLEALARDGVRPGCAGKRPV